MTIKGVATCCSVLEIEWVEWRPYLNSLADVPQVNASNWRNILKI